MKKFDSDFATHLALTYINQTRQLAQRFKSDPEKAERLERQECKFCYYRCVIAGQAFTAYKCGICGKESMHSNTATPRLCLDCAKNHNLCVQCGANIELRPKKARGE